MKAGESQHRQGAAGKGWGGGPYGNKMGGAAGWVLLGKEEV